MKLFFMGGEKEVGGKTDAGLHIVLKVRSIKFVWGRTRWATRTGKAANDGRTHPMNREGGVTSLKQKLKRVGKDNSTSSEAKKEKRLGTRLADDHSNWGSKVQEMATNFSCPVGGGQEP